jgi:hypothetical protein
MSSLGLYMTNCCDNDPHFDDSGLIHEVDNGLGIPGDLQPLVVLNSDSCGMI